MASFLVLFFIEYSAKSREMKMVLTWLDGIFVKNPCNDGEGAVSQNSEGSGYHNPVVVSLSFTHHLQVLYLFNKRRISNKFIYFVLIFESLSFRPERIPKSLP